MAVPTETPFLLEIGAGTGAFTEIVLGSCEPSAIIAVESAPEQIEWAAHWLKNVSMKFRIADAHLLPFGDRLFDVIASTFVMNFLDDRSRALGEIRRTGRRGAIVAAGVWDFAADGAPNSYLVLGLRRMGIHAPLVPGSDASSLDSLMSPFEVAGFGDIAPRAFDVSIRFQNFEQFWKSQTPSFSPVTKIIDALNASNRARLIGFVRDQTVNHDGSVSCRARANAIRARVR